MEKLNTAAVINLGCKVNKYESDSMKDKLLAAGIQIVEPEQAADVYIVNTCSVTNMAQKKSRQMLRRAKKMNPKAIIVAAGCYVNAEHDGLKQEEFVDIVVSNNCKKDIVTALTEYLKNQSAADYYVDINQTKQYEEMGSLEASHLDHQRAYIKIQDGCNQFCSYCIIPYTRGRVRSRSPQNILEEITALAKGGVNEFVLTGIHISSYGVDFRGETVQYEDMLSKQSGNSSEEKSSQIGLGELIREIAQIPEVKRIRLGSLEPRIITKEFLTKIKESGKVCPHFHLSLQSACNATLKRMNRKYTIEEFKEKCQMLRDTFEYPAITTDVIVGFPGETEEEFLTTKKNLEELNLYEIHVFKYSVREGTVAQKMPNQVPEQIKGERSDRILALTARQKQEFEEQFSGKEEEVLVEELLKEEDASVLLKEAKLLEEQPIGEKTKINTYTGHTRNYIKVKIVSSVNIVNQVVKVRIL